MRALYGGTLDLGSISSAKDSLGDDVRKIIKNVSGWGSRERWGGGMVAE